MKTTEELRKLDTKKLLEELESLKKSAFKTRFEIHGGQAKNNHEIRLSRKQIARVKTLIKEKQQTTNQAS
ncbi:MAG: 50S ribosomal protein L29 [bacterium]|nr:50S ribosomal protein L29 [bacterium]